MIRKALAATCYVPALVGFTFLAASAAGFLPVSVATLYARQATEHPGVALLAVMLACSPIQRLTNKNWMIVRKHAGIAVGLVFIENLGIFLTTKSRFSLSTPFIAVVTIATPIVFALLLTSTKSARRKLGALRWKRLHQTSWFLSAAVIAHIALNPSASKGIAEVALLAALILRLPGVVDVIAGSRGRTQKGARLVMVTSIATGLIAASSCVSIRAPHTTIVTPGQPLQTIINKAHAGDTIVVASGVWNEAILVTTPGITIQGADRAATIFDGAHTLPAAFAVHADDVVITNLTAQNYTHSGVIVGRAQLDTATYGAGQSVERYEMSYVTTLNNGLYGVYAFNSIDGIIDNVYAAGHPDSGIYVGQCKPCNVTIANSVAENNAIGYYGTNSSGGIVIEHNIFRENRVGLAPNSQKLEQLAPQTGATIRDNIISGNNNLNAPATVTGVYGVGVMIAGGQNNIVTNNSFDTNPIDVAIIDSDGYVSKGNAVEADSIAIDESHIETNNIKATTWLQPEVIERDNSSPAQDWLAPDGLPNRPNQTPA